MPVIKLKNNEISYDFSFEQKYLFIRGDSGIGKTSLIQLVSDYNTKVEFLQEFQSGVKIFSYDYLKKHKVYSKA